MFEEVTSALKHIREVHGADEVTRFRISKGSYWPIRCSDCDHGFTNQTALDKHKVNKGSFLEIALVIYLDIELMVGFKVVYVFRALAMELSLP